MCVVFFFFFFAFSYQLLVLHFQIFFAFFFKIGDIIPFYKYYKILMKGHKVMDCELVLYIMNIATIVFY